jgi:phospholipid transport system substrate-binding protein
MRRIFQSVAMALMLAATPTTLSVVAGPAQAQTTDPSVAQVQGFYDALTASMKMGGSAKGRYEKLLPAIEKAFDLPAMTAVAVGPSFQGLPDADKKALIEAFTRMTVANYAKNFDSFSGETFTVDPKSIARGSDHFVKSVMKTKNETIAFNYRTHQAGSEWKVIDIYLAGNISQMAQKRSDFASTFASGGAAGLTKRMNALTDQMLG